MDYKDLASRVRSKYPGVYDDLDDNTLAQKIVSKYPDAYGDTTFDDNQPSALEAGARGAAQGLTLGHADEITGALEAATSDKPYAQARDESRANYAKAKAAHPVIYGAADAAGSIPGYVGATALTGNPISGAALAGAVQGEGNSEGKDLTSVAKDTAMGGAVGAAAGKLGEMASSALAPEALARTAEENAAKAAGGTMTDFKNLGADKMRQAGRTMLDNDMLSPLADTEDIASANDAVNKEAGATIGDFLKGMTDQGEMADPQLFTNKLELLKNKLTQGGEGGHNDKIIDAVDTAIDTIKGYGDQPMTFELANHIKGLLQKAANWRMGEDSVVGSTNRQIAGSFRSTMDTALENAENPKALVDPNNPRASFEDFKQAKQNWGGSETVGDLLNKRGARELGNSTYGPLEMMAGMTGENPITGVAKATAWKMMRRYGNQNVALAADWISKNETAAMQQLGKYGPTLVNAAKQGPSSLAVTHYVLSQQDPSYRQMSQQGGEQ